jgi:hypothetical protein
MVFVAPSVQYCTRGHSGHVSAGSSSSSPWAGAAAGMLGFVEQAKYLGVIFHWDLGSERALDARLGAAAAAAAAVGTRDVADGAGASRNRVRWRRR